MNIARFLAWLSELCMFSGSVFAQAPSYEQPMAPAGGVLRWSQLWVDPTGQNDLDSDAIAWEDFELAQDATITRVRWWGEIAPPLGFRISFYHQDPGTIAVQPDIFAPGSGPISQQVYTSFVQTSVGGAMYQFDVDLTTPITFNANTRYFISVVGLTPIAYATWSWAQSYVGPNGTFWWSRGAHMYFHLADSRAVGLATSAGWPAGEAYCFGDGSGSACPCGNNSASSARAGCLHSFGMGGKLESTGTASITADDVTLWGTQMPDSSALYFQGTAQDSGGAGSAFGDGLRCASGSVVRLATKSNVTGASRYPVAGDAPISVRGLVVAPGMRTYQVWYRNAASYCQPETFNLTNGVRIDWQM